MKIYDAVLFDLDGTFIDTAPDFVIAGNQLRARHGLPELPDAAIREQVSNGAAAVTQLCLNITSDDPQFESYRQQLLNFYNDVLGKHSEIYAGLSAFVDKLSARDKRWGIVTNKPLQYAQPLLARLNLDTRCDVLICPDHVSNKKPDPESLLLACNHIDISSASTVYVGDHKRDVLAGNAANMLTIAASYGYLSEDDQPETWGASYITHSSASLCDLLHALTGLQ